MTDHDGVTQASSLSSLHGAGSSGSLNVSSRDNGSTTVVGATSMCPRSGASVADASEFCGTPYKNSGSAKQQILLNCHLASGGRSASTAFSSPSRRHASPVRPSRRGGNNGFVRILRFLGWVRSVVFSVCLIVMVPRIFYTGETGTLPYELNSGTYLEIVNGWTALLHVSIWPIVVITAAVAFFLAHKCDQAHTGAGGRCRCCCRRISSSPCTCDDNEKSSKPPESPGGRPWGYFSSWDNSLMRFLRWCCNSWPLGTSASWVLLLCLLFSIATSLQSWVQIIRPSWLWNPFMWGTYQVYKPVDIADALDTLCIEGALVSGGAIGKSPMEIEGGKRRSLIQRLITTFDIGHENQSESHLLREAMLSPLSARPLCLPESSWKTLSTNALSSRNPDDVEAVLQGLEFAQREDSGLIVNIMSRDTAHSIEALRQNVEGLLPFFSKVAVVVFENDSIDGSRAAFKKWSAEVKDKYIVDVIECEDAVDCVFGVSHRYDATEAKEYFRSSAIGRMGEFRQRIVDYVLASSTYENYSHMMVMDMDLGVSLSPLGILHSLGKMPDKTVASAGRQVWPGSFGSIIPPYDFSAFRSLESPKNKRILRFHQKFCELTPPGDRWRNQCDAVSPMHLMLVLGHDRGSGSEPYPVASAFNGATLYPLDLIRSSNAHYDMGDDEQRCEHIGFNLSLKTPMYINPKWNMHVSPTAPGGPTGNRAVKNVLRIARTPILALPIFFSNMLCMILFVSSVLTLVTHVLYPFWVKILRGTKFREMSVPCVERGKCKKPGVAELEYLVPSSPKRKISDFELPEVV